MTPERLEEIRILHGWGLDEWGNFEEIASYGFDPTEALEDVRDALKREGELLVYIDTLRKALNAKA